MSLRHAEHQSGLDQVLRVGDIMRILRHLVDHVILVVGQPRLNAVIKVSGDFSVDVWTVPTLEAATNLDHCDVTEMFMVVDPVDDNKIKVVAQKDPADVNQWEPVAVFLSPFTSTDLDQDLFAKCVDKVVRHEQVWSKITAVNAVTKSALIEKEEYPDDESKKELVLNLKKYWDSDPICTTMPIRVWQMYIVKSNKGKPEEAGVKILAIIPAKCDRCLPSELWEILQNTSAWVEMRQTNYQTTHARPSQSKMSSLDELKTASEASTSEEVPTIYVSSLEKDKGLKSVFCCGCFARRSKPVQSE